MCTGCAAICPKIRRFNARSEPKPAPPVQTTVPPAPTVTIRSDAFSPAQTTQSVLCLDVGRNRFRFLVQNARGQGCYLEDFAFPSLLTEHSPTNVLPGLLRGHPVLGAGPWQEVRISVPSPSFTLVPQPLFRKEYAGSYLSLMRGSDLPTHEFARTFAHVAEGFVSVFSVEHALVDFLSVTYPLQPLTFAHQTSALLVATADLGRRVLTEHGLWLYFEDEFVTMIYRAGGQLRLCNRFGYRTASDLAYYVLYVLDEQQLAPEVVRVELYGEITPFAETYAELSRFLPQLAFGNVPPGLSLTSEFNELPEHRYLSLYGLSLLSE